MKSKPEHERRRHKRIRCEIPCDVHLERKTIAGMIRNVSEGGLSLKIDLRPPEGEPLRLTLKPRGAHPIEIEALAWHVRRPRKGSERGRASEIGLVLSNESEAFFELVSSLRSQRPRSASRGAAPVRVRGPQNPQPKSQPARPPIPESPASEPLRQYAVQVKQDDGPRSRRVVVGCTSASEASGLCLAEVGKGWSVLEVKPL